jgi:hypothetical protein
LFADCDDNEEEALDAAAVIPPLAAAPDVLAPKLCDPLLVPLVPASPDVVPVLLLGAIAIDAPSVLEDGDELGRSIIK